MVNKMTVQNSIKYFSNKSLLQLRKYQDINEQQTKLAFEQQKDFALERLQNMATILQEAIMLKIFDDYNYYQRYSDAVNVSETLSSVDLENLI